MSKQSFTLVIIALANIEEKKTPNSINCKALSLAYWDINYPLYFANMFLELLLKCQPESWLESDKNLLQDKV